MIETINGRRVFVTAEQGIRLWQLVNGERQPQSKRERLYKQNTKRVFLSRMNAPQSYMQRYGHVFASMDVIPDKKAFVQACLPYKG